ncbi:hypothetical protein N9M66_00665 [Litoreibacter sp.]|nr:hypothetical protein [Litoreibacter sp.]
MSRSGSKRSSPRALFCIVSILLLSGALRVGGVGLAVASESEDADINTSNTMEKMPEVGLDTQALLRVIKERTAVLDKKERELVDRSYSLDAAQKLIERNLTRLAEAEERLQLAIAKVDGASEDDLDRLTTVYESMKPKVAAALFEQMKPEFAAGFLGRMAPQAAAGIMSGLPSESAYAISVILAGRNANAPKN